MNLMAIITLIESLIAPLETLIKSLIDAGVIPVDHPAVAHLTQTKQAVSEAKASTTP